MLRLRAIGELDNNGQINGHRTILNKLAEYNMKISEKSGTMLCDMLIPKRESWVNGTFMGNRQGIHFNTDGSYYAFLQTEVTPITKSTWKLNDDNEEIIHFYTRGSIGR